MGRRAKRGNCKAKLQQSQTKNKVNICDLPMVLLWEILGTLDGDDLLEVARTDPMLLHATKHLSGKEFDIVDCVAVVEPDADENVQKPAALEMLFHGARVELLNYDLDARLIDVSGLSVFELTPRGDDCEDKVAMMIEKIQPEMVNLGDCKYKLTPRLLQVISTIDNIVFEEVGLELLDHITQWNFESLECRLPNPEGDLAPRFFETVRTLLDQRKNGQRRAFQLHLGFQSPFDVNELPSNIIGDNYPLEWIGSGKFKCGIWESHPTRVTLIYTGLAIWGNCVPK